MATSTSDIQSEHPDFTKILPEWVIQEDGHEGERKIKSRVNVYLPTTSGQRALGLGNDAGGKPKEGQALYNAYIIRANYPTILKDTANALVGVMNREPPIITLSPGLEEMETNATAQGEPLAGLIRRLQLNQLLFGRTALFADVDASRNIPYLVDYRARSIINWDDEVQDAESAERAISLVVLNESRDVRDGFTWEFQEKYRALRVLAGSYTVTIEDNGTLLADIVPTIQGNSLDHIPFVFINASDLVPELGDIPLAGLGRLALTIYRGDADYRQALFMQGQDTLVIVGENIDPDDPDQQLIVGAGAHINIPNESGAAYFIGADSMGLPEMRTGQENDFERASNYGLQMMSGKGAEAAETLRIKVAARTATLVNVAETSAAGLQQMLKICAEWIGDNPDDVTVKANTDFIDEAMPSAELLGLMNAKARGAPLSTRSIHANMRRGDLTKLTFDEETEAIDDEPPVDSGSLLGEPDGDQAGAGNLDNLDADGNTDNDDDDQE